MEQNITKISNNINVYLLKTNNGKFYNTFKEQQSVTLYDQCITNAMIMDFKTKDKATLDQLYKTKRHSLHLFINIVKKDDLIVMSGFQNKCFMLGTVVKTLCGNDSYKMGVLWLKEIGLCDIHMLYKFIYNKQILTDVTVLKSPILRLLYPVYHLNQDFHINVMINQINPILFKSLYGIQSIIYDQLVDPSLRVKVHLESPGIIEFISDHYDTILIVLKIIKVLIDFKHKREMKEDILYQTYLNYEIETLELALISQPFSEKSQKMDVNRAE